VLSVYVDGEEARLHVQFGSRSTNAERVVVIKRALSERGMQNECISARPDLG
jgi:hypothetical protein